MMPATDNDILVEAEDLVAHWGERRILNKVSLQVHKGEILVIMGGSGSGKSTLLRHLLGLNRPTSGRIRLFGKDLNRLGNRELHDLRSRIGMSFQAGALFNSLTVGENIALPLREHTQLDEETMQIMVRMKLELVSLGGFEGLMPAQLSGGMLKRAALARAIVLDPPLLFFDEPSSGLDPVVASELDDLILRLRDTLGTTIVVVTHELESTYRIADRVVILAAGEFVFCGTIPELEKSEDRRIQDLLHRRSAKAEKDPEAFLARLTQSLE